MSSDRQDQVISLIYDAALDGARWDDALVAVADLVGGAQCVLQIFNRHGVASGYAPMMAPEAVQAYTDLWRDTFPCWQRTSAFAVGQVFSLDHIEDRDAFQRTKLYREWWAAQDLGFGARGANLASDGGKTALASVYKRAGEEFSSEERTLFDGLVDHLIRAVSVQRRLQIAEIGASRGADRADNGFLVVDRSGRLLSEPGPTCERLGNAGFLARRNGGVAIETPGRTLERMIAGKGKSAGGRCDLTGRDGSMFRFTVAPVREQTGGDRRWLQIDRPAALIHVSAPAERRRCRLEELVARHGLTPAEAAVAVEISLGDGRAAAGRRLGIRETTVRSHLGAIFDKIGVRRQAELARLVTEA